MKIDISQIHTDLQSVARKMPNISFTRRNIWLFRFLTRLIPPAKLPRDILVENTFIHSAIDGAKIRLRIYKRKSPSAPTPVLLWLHGGGYVMGSPEQDDGICIQYVRELGIQVVSVDYRLAPKYPFPVGLEDGYTALQWIVKHAQTLGIDENRIAIGGASAGGGLAASLIHLACDRQEIKPAFQILVYPMLDDRTVIRPEIENIDHIAWNQKSNRFGWESYLGTSFGSEVVPEFAVPARRSDLTGLPPAWIGVGSIDLFYDEDLAYAQRLLESGVQCEQYTVSGAFHGFDVFDSRLPVVQEFRKSQMASLKQHLLL